MKALQFVYFFGIVLSLWGLSYLAAGLWMNEYFFLSAMLSLFVLLLVRDLYKFLDKL